MRMIGIGTGRGVTLSRNEWANLVRAMHGEDDGSWILSRSFTNRDLNVEDCVAFTGPASSLVIFITHLVEVLRHPQESPVTVLEDVRYMADQMKVIRASFGSGRTHETYYFPRVRVTGRTR